MSARKAMTEQCPNCQGVRTEGYTCPRCDDKGYITDTFGVLPPVDPNAPFRVWHLAAPFTKRGFPVMGNLGSRIENVIVMRAETFQRLIREVPGMATAHFEIGTYTDD